MELICKTCGGDRWRCYCPLETPSATTPEPTREEIVLSSAWVAVRARWSEMARNWRENDPHERAPKEDVQNG